MVILPQFSCTNDVRRTLSTHRRRWSNGTPATERNLYSPLNGTGTNSGECMSQGCAMDGVAILSRIIRRNTLRQAHGLLLLNVAIEYAHQLSVAGNASTASPAMNMPTSARPFVVSYWRNIRLSTAPTSAAVWADDGRSATKRSCASPRSWQSGRVSLHPRSRFGSCVPPFGPNLSVRPAALSRFRG
jgi:hypothetical protein